MFNDRTSCIAYITDLRAQYAATVRKIRAAKIDVKDTNRQMKCFTEMYRPIRELAIARAEIIEVYQKICDAKVEAHRQVTARKTGSAIV